jgi:A/G-specific adenine glycosylase
VKFATQVIQWQQQFGRHDLPWQGTRDPYRIWVSEIMLQQTQVSTVLGYYDRFLKRFPDIQALAAAPQDDVLALWAGLGYYSRGRNLHRAAQLVVAQHAGVFPTDQAALIALPGIGRSTAAAILAFSAGQATPILDGNVKRVFCRFFGVQGDPGNKAVVDDLWRIASEQMPAQGVVPYTQGLMDLGATLCTRSKPRCLACPLAADCYANKHHQQAQLPQRKKTTVSPVRAQVFLIVRRQNELLLQRQPDSGIWGGLFSLPRLLEPTLDAALLNTTFKSARKPNFVLTDAFLQSAWLNSAHDWVHQEIGLTLQTEQVRFVAHFTHAFTHYKLLGICIEVQLDSSLRRGLFVARDSDSDATQMRWFDKTNAQTVGLPKPIAQLALFDLANTD